MLTIKYNWLTIENSSGKVVVAKNGETLQCSNESSGWRCS